MFKVEAYNELKQGKKITHRSWGTTAYIYMDRMGVIRFDDGIECAMWFNNTLLDDDWTLYDLPIVNHFTDILKYIQ